MITLRKRYDRRVDRLIQISKMRDDGAAKYVCMLYLNIPEKIVKASKNHERDTHNTDPSTYYK
jgi:hypothetical protein